MSEPLETIGPYKIAERIARSTTGNVYRATEESTGRTVAVKVLPKALGRDETSLERYQTDAEALSTLNHPNVVRLTDYGRDGDQAYIAMEYGSGTSLEALLERRRLSLQEAFNVFKKVALGLAALHGKGIVHRDLHPRNVLVSDDLSEVKLAGFGIGQADSRTRERDTMAATAINPGALHYMAPEVAVDSSTADERADIYSLGVLLYQMLTGAVPVGRFNLPSRASSEVPADIDPLALKCLEGDPAARYQSVTALLRDVDRLEDRLRLGLMSELKGIGRTFKRPGTHLFRHRHKLALVLVSLVAIAVVGIGVWKWLGARAPADTGSAPAPIQQTTAPTAGLDDLAAGEEISDDSQGDTSARAPAQAEAAASTTQGATAAPAANPPPVESAPETEAEVATADLPRPEPPNDDAARRLYEQAETSARDGELDQALAHIGNLVERYPAATPSTQGLFLRARIEEAQRRYEDAMGTYSEIGTLTGQAETRAKARYRFGRAALDSELPNKDQLALGVFDEIARAYPETEFAPLALASQAAIEDAGNVRVETEEFSRRVPAAFLTSIRIAERYPASAAAERAFWVVGTEYEELKLWQQAAEAYWQLATRFPQTELEAWWKAGQVLDRRLDDTERALEAYRQVASTSSHFEDAQKRIAKLTR